MLTVAGIGVAILPGASAAHPWWRRRTRQIVYLVMAASTVLAPVLSLKWPGLLLVDTIGAVVNMRIRGLTEVANSSRGDFPQFIHSTALQFLPS